MSNTKLKTRTLWFDGDSSYPSNKIHTISTLNGESTFVDEMTDDIRKFNNMVSREKQIKVKTENKQLTFDWVIPEIYATLDVRKYIIDRLSDVVNAATWNNDEVYKRAVRVSKELKLYKQHNLFDVLRVLIYIINTLNDNSVVWGVGRGSSVSSYVLYLIGVHDVDSVLYDLPIEDFLK